MLAEYLLATFAIKTNALQHMELNIQFCNIFLMQRAGEIKKEIFKIHPVGGAGGSNKS